MRMMANALPAQFLEVEQKIQQYTGQRAVNGQMAKT